MLAGISRRLLTPSAGVRCYSTRTGDVVAELEARGLVQTLTSRALRSHLASAPRTIYSGVDPSASSLHVGNLVPLVALAHFARYGHTPIVLVGGATGSIGDPSGRSSERNALDAATLATNVAGIQSQLTTFFANVATHYGEEGGMGVRMMDNYSWMSGVTMLDFLGRVGRHARLTQMLARESVASRLEGEGMSYTEFSYQLLQAYDFAHLHAAHGCTVQLGGSDQLGNISAGIDLIRRTTGGSSALQDDPAYGLTLPLLTTASGEKFGKSAGNAVWLDGERTSDLDFYQFFLRAADADVATYLYALTLLEPTEIADVLQAHEADKRQRSAQRVLAQHITLLIRGPQAVHTAQALTHLVAADPDNTATILKTLDMHRATQIVVSLPRDRARQDLTRTLAEIGLAKSRADAKRLVAARGLYLNNAPVDPSSAAKGIADVHLVPLPTGGSACLLRAGKSAIRILHLT